MNKQSPSRDTGASAGADECCDYGAGGAMTTPPDNPDPLGFLWRFAVCALVIIGVVLGVRWIFA